MDNFENAINGIKEFLATESVQGAPCPSSPFGEGVGKVLEKFASLAHGMGFTVHNEGGYYVTADIGEGEPFAILGHLDTVPLGEGWDRSPLGEIADGYLYGRGVLDDKGPLLLCLYAAEQLLKEGYAPCRKIRFFAAGSAPSATRKWTYGRKKAFPRTQTSPSSPVKRACCTSASLCPCPNTSSPYAAESA